MKSEASEVAHAHRVQDAVEVIAFVLHDARVETVDGFHARVVQHECDHLDGILYPMRMRDFSRFGYTEILFPEMAEADD